MMRSTSLELGKTTKLVNFTFCLSFLLNSKAVQNIILSLADFRKKYFCKTPDRLRSTKHQQLLHFN